MVIENRSEKKTTGRLTSVIFLSKTSRMVICLKSY